ncbi:chromosomal replication initiator protein DnaA [Parasulfuritortus cantonensis]|uniref:Chromosomal replication initiator protein DnaA n=1 Tax=Parasulfuritortus cantonensis TaxID=2528202 RepID=A0A4R1B7T6_9PROT|nr:chromosomal replication initiator protein DnaA [Parasulfuritortus cantonensis]TCJ12718.1 chromosomal replication initiator protein DnaA [Parasulfuritortus cantonensis]
MHDFWSHCLGHFQVKLNAQQVNTWIKPLTVSVAEDQIRISAPNRFVAQWIKDKFLGDIEDLAASYFSKPTPVAVIVEAKGKASPQTGESAPAAAPGPRGAGAAEKVPPSESRLNANFTFSSFVRGKANDLARAAALQVADNPGSGYNPLFVYGGVGMGKTHLIQAIGNKVLENNPKAQVRYIHAERYVSDMVKAFRHKSFDEFKRKYDSLDILLIDDIQFFAGKGRTQEEFFYTFNNLIESHKQVIISSDTFPKDLEGIEERLKSRFSWGLTVMLEPPELEMRVAILLNKAQQEGEHLGESTAFFIAKQVRSNVRELEGALKRVIAYARFHKQAISVELAKEALKDLLAVQNRQVSIENIQKTVSDYYKIKVADMFSKKRTRNLVRPRQMAMYLAKELTDLSLPEIGQSFGGRDHTTVLHACRKIEELKNAEPEFRKDYSLLIQVLTG